MSESKSYLSKLSPHYREDISFINSIRKTKELLIENYSYPISSILSEIVAISDLEWQITESLEIFEFKKYLSEIINHENFEIALQRILLISDTHTKNGYMIKLAEYFNVMEERTKAKLIYSLQSDYLLATDLTDQAVGGWVENANLIYLLVCSMKYNGYEVDKKLLERMLLFSDLEQSEYGNSLYTLSHIEDEVNRRKFSKETSEKFLNLDGKESNCNINSIKSLKQFIPSTFWRFDSIDTFTKRDVNLIKIQNIEKLIEKLDEVEEKDIWPGDTLPEILQSIIKLLQKSSFFVKQQLISIYEENQKIGKSSIISDLTYIMTVCTLIEENKINISCEQITHILKQLENNYLRKRNELYCYRTRPKISPRLVYLLQLLLLEKYNREPEIIYIIVQDTKSIITQEFFFKTPTELMNQYSLFQLIEPSFLNKVNEIFQLLEKKYFSS